MELNGIIAPEKLNDFLNLKGSRADVKILQAINTDADRAHFASERLHDASSFDLSVCSDTTSGLPKTLPRPPQFEAYVQGLGISNSSLVVVYDAPSARPVAAARTWWMFRVFGHDNVVVLDGGFARWKELGFSTETGFANALNHAQKSDFHAQFTEKLFRTRDEVLLNVESNQSQLIDTRMPESFSTNSIAGAKNLFFQRMWDEERPGQFRGEDALKDAFDKAGVDLKESTIAYCNSGVTSCTVILAAFICGKRDVSNYDGSWSEWSKNNVF